jgi:L-alanine-DL-glutamate epimerase-like enolase superfamily enzyme
MAHHQPVGQGHLGGPQHALEDLAVSVLTLPTEHGPEADGTLVWRSTTMVLVEVRASGVTGIGWTYEDAAAARIIADLLRPCLLGLDAMAIPTAAARMVAAVRNQGVPGVAAAAISAVDVALWDLKARLLDVSVASLLGSAHREVPVYASGGFLNGTLPALERELIGYRDDGHRRVKLKIGRDRALDLRRVQLAREVMGPEVEIMVDANGAYRARPAIAMAEALAALGVVYFEEPVPQDDLAGLARVRDAAPSGIEIASGEYGYRDVDFARLLDVVDILQADATRCLGITGFLRADALCAARNAPLSAHCAPSLHLHAGAAASRLVHIEYFRDHVRFEHRIFDGAPTPVRGAMRLDPDVRGLGLSVRRREAQRRAG